MSRHLRQYSVVVDMIPVVARFSRDNEPFQPFDAPSANLAGNDSSQGFSMIRPQHFAVHFVSQHDASIRIHNPVEFDGCPVVPIWLLGISPQCSA
jgi:hypothetical protein